MKIIAIEEHWNSAAIRDALDRLQGRARDESSTDYPFHQPGNAEALFHLTW